MGSEAVLGLQSCLDPECGEEDVDGAFYFVQYELAAFEDPGIDQLTDKTHQATGDFYQRLVRADFEPRHRVVWFITRHP